MNLAYSDEELTLRDAVRDLVADRSPVSRVRELRDAPESAGFDRTLWAQLAELGLLELLAPDSGVDDATFAAGVVARELGRTLAPTPLLTTSAAVQCLGRSDNGAARALVAQITGAQVVASLAHDPSASIDVTAVRSDDGFTLTGTHRYVPFGAEADVLVVSAVLDGDVALFLVDGSLPTRAPVRLMDVRHRAHVTFDDVRLGSGALLTPDAGPILDAALLRATALLAAEQLGATEVALEKTVEHLRTREQFGVLIGTFQALQHRAARLWVETELATSLVLEALRLVDAGSEDAAEAVSAAKAFASDTFVAVTGEGVQLHGGMGMTDEVDIGLYLKRARVAAAELGDPLHHRRVVAAAKGV